LPKPRNTQNKPSSCANRPGGGTDRVVVDEVSTDLADDLELEAAESSPAPTAPAS
jgi:hypothetical protein